MPVNQKFIQEATKAQCRSLKTRNDLCGKAVRKDGDEDNGGEKNLLFPRACIEAVLTREEISWVLGCPCTLCTRQPPEPMSTASLPHHIMQNWNKRRGFAILVYMSATFAARIFFSKGLGTDGFNLREAMRAIPLPRNTNNIEFSNNFTRAFESTKLIFEPPFFQKGSVWSEFTDDHNLPFLFEKPIQNGLPSSFGTLYGFWLHKDFCAGIPSIDIPMDQTIDVEKEFLHMKLARKELVGSQTDFQSERSILEFIEKEDHPHLIKLYFWYRRGHSFNLVFPYYPASLQHVLVEGWLPRRQPAIPERFKASKLRHWLWEQILNVIEGLERVHNPGPHQDRLPDIRGILIGGHFDIKPANILIDHNGQLVLADFGQAQIKAMSHGGGTSFAGPGGTLSYQPPPEKSHDRDAQQHWHRTYDVWSMACVMLEIVHFVLGGTGRVKSFIAERESEEPPYMRSSAFWKEGRGRPVLKHCVQASLTKLKAENDRYLTMVANLLERMFTIDAKLRGSIIECLRDLSRDNLTDQWPWKDEDEISIGGDHTHKPLQKLNVSLDYTSTNESYNSIKCSLHVFRERLNERTIGYRSTVRGEAAPNDLLGENIRVVLDFEQDDIRHMQSERGIRRREVLKPLTYFPQRNPGRPQEIPEHPPLNPDSRACAFQDLHRKLTLNFRKSSDYHRFQAAMTQQRVYEVSHALISRCWVSHKKAGLGRNLPKKYSSGRVEIWKELSEKEYHDEFVARRDRSHRASLVTEEESRTSSERHNMPVSPTNPGKPTNPQGIPVHNPKTAPTPRRLVIYLESEKIFLTTILNTYVIVKNRCDHIEPPSNLCLSFIPHPGPPTAFKYFEVGEFRGSGHGREPEHGNAESLHTICPGIPLDPKVLVDNEVTRVEWLEIEFANAHDKNRFITVYNQLFPDKKIIVKGQGRA